MTPIRIAVAGCTGRMGRAIVRLAAADAAVRVVAAVTIESDANLGQDAGVAAGVDPLGVSITSTVVAPADVLIEFTSPAGCAQWARWCVAQRLPLVSGTTGLDPSQHEELRRAAQSVGVLWSTNMSIGVNVLSTLVRQAAQTLGSWDVEIVEAHHNQKADAPSGTARTLVEAICTARGVRAEDVVRPGRSGAAGPRPSGEIGVHAVRMGGVIGDHDVHFASSGEIITLRHHAASRDIFAAGALRAAKWIVGKPVGLYHMRDALGL